MIESKKRQSLSEAEVGDITAWRNPKQKEDLKAGREPRIYDHNIDKNGEKMPDISVKGLP